MKFKEPGQLNLPALDKEVLALWDSEDTFKQSMAIRDGAKPFVFYEGPPSANGLPGIHHVMARTIKDLFCRFQTQKGKQVQRKGGWDTHGLPIEINVEKSLGITKEDIGSKISVEEYNAACRKEVLKYKDIWNDITRKMGYWVDLENPYVTFEPEYIESVWNILQKLYNKGFLYKGYTVQPYSPAAGTGLSTHELNQPGCYQMVKDTTVTAQFKLEGTENDFVMAWTTTPWTLPSNVGLAVGEKIDYVKVATHNPYTKEAVNVWIAEALLGKYFKEEEQDDAWKITDRKTGAELAGLKYEQLLPYMQPEDGDAFKIILGDFVSTEDGTGIVHIAPSFGADDMRTGKQNGLGSLTMVDKQGKFIDAAGEFAGRYVKDYKNEADYKSVDIDIAVKLKKENRAFKVEKYEHSYPHCWRTGKPVLYYPLDSWFVKTTAVRERMIELNNTINWKPASTGEGRFGKWLENLVDWNLSRSRFWGTPLPIWRTEFDPSDPDGLKREEICIGSLEELRSAVEKAVEAGHMDAPLAADWDPHRPYVDRVVLVASDGRPMHREPDLIDVWFDSGAMPYAQWHYPFENEDTFKANFPADFIAEGVDQTRGWFYTLHAIATMLMDEVSFKAVVSNGLVLDKAGNKMSKSVGNVVDPFSTIEKFGADAARWYVISNSQPWDNLRFDLEGIGKVQRKFFGTLHNTYSFFALYANVDDFTNQESEVPLQERPEIDRWIISLLNSLIENVDNQFSTYEPTRGARAIQEFVNDHLSNWYVRLCRKRFWKGEYNKDKIAAYQTLHTCLLTVAKLMAPVAPFYADVLYRNLTTVYGSPEGASVHLTNFPLSQKPYVDKALEQRMQMAQQISSMVLSLRKQEDLKVRQPLSRIMVPVLDVKTQEQLALVSDLVKSEVNVKDIEFVSDTTGTFTKQIKPDFKKLGPRMGKQMKQLAKAVENFGQKEIEKFEKDSFFVVVLDGDEVRLERNEVEITTQDMPGWLVTSENGLTVALDITLSQELKDEGNAREFVNKIQRLRKDSHLNVTDRILLSVERDERFNSAAINFKDYICSEILAEELVLTDSLNNGTEIIINDIPLKVALAKN